MGTGAREQWAPGTRERRRRIAVGTGDHLAQGNFWRQRDSGNSGDNGHQSRRFLSPVEAEISFLLLN